MSEHKDIHPDAHPAADPKESPSVFPPIRQREEIDSLDIDKQEKFFLVSSEIIQRKDYYRRDRCQRCWHGPTRCICARLTPLPFTLDVRIVIFMHYLEYGNAADTSKLFPMAHPGRAELLLYGKKDDHERLRTLLSNPAQCMVLFPSDKALSVEEWRAWSSEQSKSIGEESLSLAGLSLQDGNFERDQETAPAVASGKALASGKDYEDFPNTSNTITIVVIDGTWRQAKRMRDTIDEQINADVPHVKLMPHSMDWWVQRGNKTKFSRTQALPGRVCSVEATALLLLELGEKEEVIDGLLHYVEVNTKAIRGMAVNHKL